MKYTQVYPQYLNKHQLNKKKIYGKINKFN